ncbi:MAG: hypothetical protein LBS99_05260, partial [Clostridiales bacterium]|nr:hypothetical protein [Clostridiales bacterium]
YGQVVKTSPFHGGIASSNLARVTKKTFIVLAAASPLCLICKTSVMCNNVRSGGGRRFLLLALVMSSPFFNGFNRYFVFSYPIHKQIISRNRIGY